MPWCKKFIFELECVAKPTGLNITLILQYKPCNCCQIFYNKYIEFTPSSLENGGQ